MVSLIDLVDFSLHVFEHLFLEGGELLVHIERGLMRLGDDAKLDELPFHQAFGFLDVGEGIAGKLWGAVRPLLVKLTILTLEHDVNLFQDLVANGTFFRPYFREKQPVEPDSHPRLTAMKPETEFFRKILLAVRTDILKNQEVQYVPLPTHPPWVGFPKARFTPPGLFFAYERV